MGVNNWLLVGRLRKAVKKIKLLLSLNANRWRLSSMLGASSSNRRLMSFNSTRQGLTAAIAEDVAADPVVDSSFSNGSLQRTLSYPSEDDVDKRAENFIANFYRQLQIDRQVSLELRYSRGDSFDSMSP